MALARLILPPTTASNSRPPRARSRECTLMGVSAGLRQPLVVAALSGERRPVRSAHALASVWPVGGGIGHPSCVFSRRPSLGRYVKSHRRPVAGIFASLANRLILKKSPPTRGQIANWDRLMVPLSRLLDPLLARRFGKSILGVWRKTN